MPKLFGLLALSKPSTDRKSERDEVLKRMLKMKPKPHKPGAIKSTKKQKKKT
jgi:hypothetical protein